MLMLAWRKSFHESLNIVRLNLIFRAILVDIDRYSPRYRFIQNVRYLDISFYWTFGKRYWVSKFDIDIVIPRYGATLVICGIQGMVVPFRFGELSFQFLTYHIRLLHWLFICRFILITINITQYDSRVHCRQ